MGYVLVLDFLRGGEEEGERKRERGREKERGQIVDIIRSVVSGDQQSGLGKHSLATCR